MTTHQQLSGDSDEALVGRMIRTFQVQFNATFWGLFDEDAAPRVPNRPGIVDLGCGPGLLLQALGQRFPSATLHGLDLTPAMIEQARTLDWDGATPHLEVADLTGGTIPLPDASIDLATMARTLHLFEDPFTFLRDLRRVLRPGGTFVLYDWIRVSYEAYLNRRPPDPEETQEQIRVRSLPLFAAHCKYTEEDWRWVFAESGYRIIGEARPANTLHAFVAAPLEST